MPRYIDADALISKVCGYYCGCERTECGMEEINEPCKRVSFIEDAPTVSTDGVRGVGKWEKDSDGLDVCSECGEVALQRVFIKLPDKIVDLQMVRSKFCPSCGARMGGVQDALS